jgi:hypothetical protein
MEGNAPVYIFLRAGIQRFSERITERYRALRKVAPCHGGRRRENIYMFMTQLRRAMQEKAPHDR